MISWQRQPVYRAEIWSWQTVLTLKNAKYCAVDSDGYMRMEDGTPIQLFTKVTTDGYRKVTGKDGKDYWVMNEERPTALRAFIPLVICKSIQLSCRNPPSWDSDWRTVRRIRKRRMH